MSESTIIAIVQALIIKDVCIVGAVLIWTLAEQPPSLRERYRRFARWLLVHQTRVLIVLLAGLAVGIPAIAAGWTFLYATGGHRVVWEAMLGTWPDSAHTQVWRAVGVGISAVAVLGIPTLLVVIITILITEVSQRVGRDTHARLHELERRLKMDVNEYIGERDDVFEQELFAILRRRLPELVPDMPKDKLEREALLISREATSRARKQWAEMSRRVEGEVGFQPVSVS